jgi:hypothetical protein
MKLMTVMVRFLSLRVKCQYHLSATRTTSTRTSSITRTSFVFVMRQTSVKRKQYETHDSQEMKSFRIALAKIKVQVPISIAQ